MGAEDRSPDAVRHDGVLVGWNSQDLGTKIVLKVQTFAPFGGAARSGTDDTFIHMTKSQAAVLANYLFKMAGTQPPPKPSGWRRLFRHR